MDFVPIVCTLLFLDRVKSLWWGSIHCWTVSVFIRACFVPFCWSLKVQALKKFGCLSCIFCHFGLCLWYVWFGKLAWPSIWVLYHDGLLICLKLMDWRHFSFSFDYVSLSKYYSSQLFNDLILLNFCHKFFCLWTMVLHNKTSFCLVFIGRRHLQVFAQMIICSTGIWRGLWYTLRLVGVVSFDVD